MPYSFTLPTLQPHSVQALVAANRLEARPRSPEFNRALRAEVRDAGWLLSRQWQMREFEAEDRGTPAAATVSLRQQPLRALATPGPAARPYNPQHQPLEAAVEAQPRPIGLGLRLQLGQLWLRLLPAVLNQLPGSTPDATQAAAQHLWAVAYPLAPANSDTDPVLAAQQAGSEALALVELAGGSIPDGYLLYQELLDSLRDSLGSALADADALASALATSSLAQALLLAATDFSKRVSDKGLIYGAALTALRSLGPALDEAARQYVLTVHRLYGLGEVNASWDTASMAYSFGLGTAGGQGLGTGHYPGGAALPWYAVDEQTAPTNMPPAEAGTVRTRTVLPTEVLFPGMPTARWWEFEDRRVDFGKVTGVSADWGRMLLQEFMFLYQNDWFSVPCALPTGTVCQVESLEVTDVFGQSYRIQPAGAGQLSEAPRPGQPSPLIDNDSLRWRLFAQIDPTATGPATAPRLYIPAAVLGPLVGQPSEQVSFRREEATNLVWAVENIVPDGFANGLDGSSAAAQTAQALRPTTIPTAVGSGLDADYRYELMSTVPENWLPFVPIMAADGTQALEQGVLRRQVPGRTFLDTDSAAFVQPRTALLQLHPSAPYRLMEHEVPPAGLRVEGRSYRARWHDGRVIHWFGRQRGPAQPGGSSGLAFDVLRPNER